MGHIGYGVRPSERLKGCAVQMLKIMLEEAGHKKCTKSWLPAILQIQGLSG